MLAGRYRFAFDGNLTKGRPCGPCSFHKACRPKGFLDRLLDSRSFL